MITASIRLDTYRENNIPILKIPQGDYNGREIRVVLTSLGEKIKVESFEVVTISATRPDGMAKSFLGKVNEDGSVSVPVARWMLDVEGEVVCSVSVAGADSKYTTNEFFIEVTYSPNAESSGEGDFQPGNAIVVELSAQIEELRNQVEGLVLDAPYIGENGNWFVKGEDTGINAEGFAPTIEVINQKKIINYFQNNGLVAIPEGAKNVTVSGTCSGYMSGGDVYFVLVDADGNIISNAHIGSGSDDNILEVFAALDIPDNAAYFGAAPSSGGIYEDNYGSGYTCNLKVEYGGFTKGVVTLIITNKTGSETIVIEDGKDGTNGVSPTISVSAITGGHRITITDKNGTKTVDIMDGSKGADGRGIKTVARTSGTGAAGTTDTYTITYTDNTTSTFTVYNGKNGTNGTNGTSVTVQSVSESSADGGDNVVTFSDGKTLSVKNGKTGAAGKDGNDYVLTPADKSEIAEMVDGATIVQAPKYVNSVDEMTDQSRVYVMASTGRVWAYMDTTVEQEVTIRDDIKGTTDNPYQTGRLSSGGALSSDISTHTLTPYIDLTKAEYQGKTIELHLEGNRYFSEGSETYIMSAVFDANKGVILGRGYSMLASGGTLDELPTISAVINGQTSATLTIPIPLSHKGGTKVGYLRFCGLGTVTDSVYITYKGMQTVTGGAWVDTGTSYTPSLSTDDLNAVAEQAAAIVDNNLLSVIGSGEVSV